MSRRDRAGSRRQGGTKTRRCGGEGVVCTGWENWSMPLPFPNFGGDLVFALFVISRSSFPGSLLS